MLSESIYGEVQFLVHAVLLGIVITFVYDNIRVIRRVIRHNTFFISMEDLFFWIWVSLAVFLLQHKENDGIFRWFSVIGGFLGMLVYRKIISRFYVTKMTILLRKLLHILYLFFSYLFSPIYFVEKKTGNFLKKIWRTVTHTLTVQKIRLTHKRKMIKMTLCKHKKKQCKKERDKNEQKNSRSEKASEWV